MPCPGVADPDVNRIPLEPRARRDRTVALDRLACVGHQVEDRLAQQVRIALDFRKFAEIRLHRDTRPEAGPGELQRAVHDLVHVDGVRFGVRNAGRHLQAANQAVDALGRHAIHPRQLAAGCQQLPRTFRRRLGRRLFQAVDQPRCDIQIAENRAGRRADLVRHARQQPAQRGVPLQFLQLLSIDLDVHCSTSRRKRFTRVPNTAVVISTLSESNS